MKQWTLGAALAATAILVGCGGGGGGGAGIPTSGPRLLAVAPVPNYDATTNVSSDLGMVSNGRFYYTDRNNKAVEVFDAASNAFIGSITGFTGMSAPNAAPAT